jgi:hypothetical protein
VDVPASGKQALAAAKKARGKELDLLDLVLSGHGEPKFDAAREEVRARLARRSKAKPREYGVSHSPSRRASRGRGGRR